MRRPTQLRQACRKILGVFPTDIDLGTAGELRHQHAGGAAANGDHGGSADDRRPMHLNEGRRVELSGHARDILVEKA